MFDWFNNIFNQWQYIFIYGLTDWLGDNFSGPLLSRGGMMGAYVNSGLVFAAKQAVPATSYFTGLGGTFSGLFGKKT